MRHYEVVLERRDYYRLSVDAKDYEEASRLANQSMNDGEWGRQIESQVSVAFINEVNLHGDVI